MSQKPKEEDDFKAVAENRQARHSFFILEKYEAGIALRGSEVKSVREGTVQLKEGYALVRNGELFLEGVHINPYSYATQSPPEAVRSRKLLMHKREIKRIDAEIQQKKLTLVPLRVYFKKGRAKVELGLAKGKKAHDKRDSIKAREAQRTIDRAGQKYRKV